MPALPAITRFTDEELARAPHLFDEVMAGLLARLTRPAADEPPNERLRMADLAQGLASRRHRMVADYSASLALRARHELQRNDAAPPAAPARSAIAGLSLVDETAVAADVETSRAAEAIKVTAEHELRELGAFLSALAGETKVTRNHVVLNPDVQARSLWDAARQLPDEKDLRSLFMRHATPPLAAALRKQWAGACTRLEDAGIQPAAYRTVILNAGVRTDLGITSAPRPTGAVPAMARTMQLLERRIAAEQMRPHAAPYHGPAAAAPIAPPATRAAAAGATPIRPEPRSDADLVPPPEPRVDAMRQIFDALLADGRLEPDFRPALTRLREPAVDAALRDPLTVTSDAHPLWAFVDRIVWQGRTLPAPPQRERVRTMQVVNGLVDQLAKEARLDASRFQWAHERLVALERNRLERRIAQQAPQIAALDAVDRQLADAHIGCRTSVHVADLTHLPTVPSTLYDAVAPTIAQAPADAWLDGLAAGDVARLLIQGRWILAQLLWRSASGEVWLWADCASDELWPVRRGALSMLFQGELAGSVTCAGFVRDVVQELGARTGRDATR